MQHTKTKALKSQTVPEALRGKTVDYTPSGPRIADFEPIKKRKKMVVAPEEPAPQEPSAPTLPPRESKRLKTAALSPIPEAEEATPTPLVAVPPATAGKKRKAEETTTSEAQEPKKKRRPGRPKLTPARVENSSSE